MLPLLGIANFLLQEEGLDILPGGSEGRNDRSHLRPSNLVVLVLDQCLEENIPLQALAYQKKPNS